MPVRIVRMNYACVDVLTLLPIDDASSTSISIHFHSTSPDHSKPPNLLAKCDKIIFKNNGMAFRPEDWQRLKRIAEGNPGNKPHACDVYQLLIKYHR